MDAEVVLQLHRTNEKTKAFFSAKLGKLGFGDVRSTEVVKSEGIDIGAWRKIEIIPHNFGTNPD